MVVTVTDLHSDNFDVVCVSVYGQVLVSDAVAVVGDLDELEAAFFYDDIYGRGVGVEAVLDELLHGGDWPLDDLSGGNAVDDRLV